MGISQSVTEKMEEETRLTKLSVNAFVIAKSLGCMYSSFYGHKCLFVCLFFLLFNLIIMLYLENKQTNNKKQNNKKKPLCLTTFLIIINRQITNGWLTNEIKYRPTRKTVI